jgi:hypothetical protein
VRGRANIPPMRTQNTNDPFYLLLARSGILILICVSDLEGEELCPLKWKKLVGAHPRSAVDAVDECAGRPAEGRRCESVTVKA